MSAPEPSNAPELSVILPIHNEEGNIGPLCAELEQVIRGTGRTFEIVCVDDKSCDGSRAEIHALQRTRPWLRCIAHRVNQGQSAAFATGFRHARGSILVTMDADGQNDPASLPAMLARLEPGVAAVCGVRAQRRDAWTKRASSRIANGFRDLLLGDNVQDAGCSYRVLRAEAAREIPVFNGMHRFFTSILRFQGYTCVEVPVGHRPRTRGVSKYGIGNRLWRGIRDCLAMRWYQRRALRGDRIEGEL